MYVFRSVYYLSYFMFLTLVKYVMDNTRPLKHVLVNKPLRAAGMSADNVCPKMDIMKFWGQSLSQGHYQLTYQQARKGFIYFITVPLNFISYLNRSQKASVDLNRMGAIVESELIWSV